MEGDDIPPVVQLLRPIHGLYIFNQKIIPLTDSVVFGKIDIYATASDEHGIAKVEFYIDYKLEATDDTDPYSWTWSKFSFAWHILKVVAYDNAGNTRSVEYKVWKFF